MKECKSKNKNCTVCINCLIVNQQNVKDSLDEILLLWNLMIICLCITLCCVLRTLLINCYLAVFNTSILSLNNPWKNYYSIYMWSLYWVLRTLLILNIVILYFSLVGLKVLYFILIRSLKVLKISLYYILIRSLKVLKKFILFYVIN